MPEGLKSYTIVGMCGGISMAVATDDRHLLKQSLVGHAVDAGEDAGFGWEAVRLLIYTRIMPAVLVLIPLVWEPKGCGGKVAVDVFAVMVDTDELWVLGAVGDYTGLDLREVA